ncbi:MAG: DUF1236 domain-containing protein, partial [Mesorhizobium sp.]
MKHLLITSMIALGVGCGAAVAQTESVQPSGGDSCAAGQADCPKGGKAGEQAQGKMKSQTEQNAQGKTGTTTDQNAQGTTKMQTEQNAQGKTGTTTEQNAQGNVQTDQDKTASITNVTVEQRTQITQIIRETNVQPVRDVSFDISIGVEVPRQKIRLHRLPARIVKIVPAYETYMYFVLA